MKNTIKKIVAIAALASMAFGFGAGVQANTSKEDVQQAVAIKEPPIYKDPSDI